MIHWKIAKHVEIITDGVDGDLCYNFSIAEQIFVFNAGLYFPEILDRLVII